MHGSRKQCQCSAKHVVTMRALADWKWWPKKKNPCFVWFLSMETLHASRWDWIPLHTRLATGLHILSHYYKMPRCKVVYIVVLRHLAWKLANNPSTKLTCHVVSLFKYTSNSKTELITCQLAKENKHLYYTFQKSFRHRLLAWCITSGIPWLLVVL